MTWAVLAAVAALAGYVWALRRKAGRLEAELEERTRQVEALARRGEELKKALEAAQKIAAASAEAQARINRNRAAADAVQQMIEEGGTDEEELSEAGSGIAAGITGLLVDGVRNRR